MVPSGANPGANELSFLSRSVIGLVDGIYTQVALESQTSFFVDSHFRVHRNNQS